MASTGGGRSAVSPNGRLVRAPKTAELITAHLRRQIVTHQLEPGDRLPPEVELMEQYGVSRPTLREAFRILETEGLIAVRRGSRGGAVVMSPDLAVAARYVGLILQVQGTTIRDVTDARLVSEPICARLLAKRRTKADLADLRGTIDELEQVVDEGIGPHADPRRWSGLTYRFHELIMERCGNRTLAVQGGVLQEIVSAHYETSVAARFNDPETARSFTRTIRSYTKLADLVEARDGDGAEAHWRRHLEVAATHLLGGDEQGKPLVDLFSEAALSSSR